MTTELTVSPALADELKALRRDKDYGGGPVIVDARGTRDRGTPSLTNSGEVRSGVPRSLVDAAPGVLAAVERSRGPVILAADGVLGVVELALCCVSVVAYVGPDATLGEIVPATALSLGLAGRLTERLGPGAAAQILIGAAHPRVLCSPQGDKGRGVTGPMFALGLAVAADDPLAAARAAAARLADPAAALLPRSLAFAARSTPVQAAAYDLELLALTPDQPIDQERPR